MCLGIPMKVVEVNLARNIAKVEIGGTQQWIRLHIVNEIPKIGDYVIVHAGFALYRLDEKEAKETLSLFEEMLRHEAPLP